MIRRPLVWFAAMLLGIAAMPVLHAATQCRHPDWAPVPMKDFTLAGCTDKPFDSVDVYLADGSRTLKGRVMTFDYEHRDGAPDVSNDAVRRYQIQQAQKAGAKLMTRDEGFNAVLMKKDAQGEAWYEYDHGSGNDSVTGSYTLTTVIVGGLAQEVVAQSMKAPLDVSGKACANPPWLQKQFAAFKLAGCDAKAWDTREIGFKGGSKKLQGKRLTVNFKLVDPAKEPTAISVQQNYVVALQKIGAKLMTDPKDGYRAVLTQTTPQGEYWYIYAHGGGNENSTTSYSLTTFELGAIAQEVVAQAPKGSLEDVAVKGCANPPWLVKQFDYFKLRDCTRRDYDSITVDLPGGPKTLVGHFLDVNYVLADPKKDPTAKYVQANFVAALEKIGAKLVSRPDDAYHAVLAQNSPQGQWWYIYTHGSGNENSTTSYSLTTLQVGGPPPVKCTLTVYGVQFDFDKSTLKPESTPVLEQVLAIFKADPSYRAEIGGHTDNVGTPAYNMKLSGARAEAVKAWLVAHGIASARITTHGYGDTVPLVPNTSDANRAQNRRVELKRENCR